MREYNWRADNYFRGSVQPEGAEATLNGYKLKKRRQIDWETQARLAENAFTHNGFFLLIDNRQIENLDDEIEIRLKTEVSFVKLTPLLGG